MDPIEKVNDLQAIDCSKNPVESLTQMFVGIVQKGRIAKGQCPALRPVFLKPHGVAQGEFRIRPDLPNDLKVGVFAGTKYRLWARFSSDTVPTVGDFTTTIGVGLKLFDAPTPKIFGQPDDRTFDFIMQNMDVFFVDTARDMCEFTKAGVVDQDYAGYLDSHPRTKEILDLMAKPVGSVLASEYWGILPFAFGADRFVKYKLEPTVVVPAPTEPPSNPTYLESDFAQRLLENEVVFRFCIQLRTNDTTMPLDQATVAWSVDESPFIHVGDIVFPMQDVTARGQASYGENLSFNIWRVTQEHRPQGSIAEARREVYAASAELRRNVNGIPNGEPTSAKAAMDLPPCKDTRIVRAAIHPGIGIARVGDSETEFYIGPEVTDAAASLNPNEYRTKTGELKRQAARFRIYGYNAAGEVVRELTSNTADITWSVHLANSKADWFQFITAMDIPESKDLVLNRRNPAIQKEARQALVIDPGPRSIAGVNQKGQPEYRFDTGEFKGIRVYLGELQTDAMGRLVVLGGRGVSVSPSGAPPYNPSEPNSFNNAGDWYDDIADGPVDANVRINGVEIPVEGAWVASAPPNYAPNVIGWRTMYDLLVDVYVGCGWLPVPIETSFMQDVLPVLQRMTNLQWVNKGFFAMFGCGRPLDFNDSHLIGRLAQAPSGRDDPYKELRNQILNAFRSLCSDVNEPRIWPWIYGDSFDSGLFAESSRTMLALPKLQQLHLQRWADGDFVADWKQNAVYPQTIDDVLLADQPDMLNKASLHYCLADAFHPGCELTWPIRHPSIFTSPFRIRRRRANENSNIYGSTLDQNEALAPNGPLYSQGPGDLTRWMGIPWQGDTAYCRSGYDPEFDPYLPSFWPARVPNWVLSEEDYKIVVDTCQTREQRLFAFNRRVSWYRFIDTEPSVADRMKKMIAIFGAQGIVEARVGVPDDPDFPEVIYVESLREEQKEVFRVAAATSLEAAEKAPIGSRLSRIHLAGWTDERHLLDALNLRARRKSE